MNRIDQTFERLRASKQKGLITYLTVGSPDLAVSAALVMEMARCGADMVELGVPFSDPVADGPVIQAAAERALKKGVTLADVLALAKGLRPKTEIPLLLMTYYNPIHSYGMTTFVDMASRSGIDGVIVPDLPLEESAILCQALANTGIHFIYFLSPTSSPERIANTVKLASGFIYCISATGVTGVRDALPETGLKLLSQVRTLTPLPLALGFGISGPEQLTALGKDGDAVIIGSAIVRLVEEKGTADEIISRVRNFLKTFK
ncbi:MAG TPA: tryptophan synthase subunit alpha [Candidatus Limnocylindrales bacterium]|nr:tryptophan synthase subunit alpha [Candidatus Limnocylindrales bacterium]